MIPGDLHGLQAVQKQGYVLLKEKEVCSSTGDSSYGLMEETEFSRLRSTEGRTKKKHMAKRSRGSITHT